MGMMGIMKMGFSSVLFVLLTANAMAAASSSTIPISRTETSATVATPEGDDDVRLQLQFRPEATAVFGNQSSVQTIGAGAGIIYGMSPKLGIGSGIRHVFEPGVTADSVFTEFDVRLVFAPTGGLVLTQEQFRDGWRRSGGLRFQAVITQYYFAGEVTPSSGLGLGASYEWPLTRRLNSMIGGRIDRVSDGIVARIPVEAYAGFGFRL